MNIPSKLDKLHSFYGKAKYAFLAVFALTIMFSATVSHGVYGDSVVGTVETQIALKMDGNTKKLTTTQNTIGGALAQNSISLTKNDITEPPLDTYLSGKSLNVQVVRAIPVLVSDNGQSWSGHSAYTQPQDILKQLNVEIFPEDKVSAELILDPAAEGAVGQKVVILRAPIYTVYVDDTTKVVRSWATNIADMLAEKGISLGVNDIVEPGKAAGLSGVSEITVTRINYADIAQMESIDYTTTSQYDFSMYRGQSKVIQVGVNGSKNVNYHIVYKNGVEISRTITSSELVSSPITKEIAKGAIPTDDKYGWWPTIISAANHFGVDPVGMYDVMNCESAGRDWIGEERAYNLPKGLFQYRDDTWIGASDLYPGGQYSGVLITNGTAQIYVTAWKVSKEGWRAWSCKP